MGGCKGWVLSILERALSVQRNVTRAGDRRPARLRGSVSLLLASKSGIVT